MTALQDPTMTVSDIARAAPASEGDPSVVNDKEVKVTDDKEAAGRSVIAGGYDATLQTADVIAQEWRKRVARDSVKHYACPWEKAGRDRPMFLTPEECRNYMVATYPLKVEEAKLFFDKAAKTNAPKRKKGQKAAPLPVFTIESIKLAEIMVEPKRTIADFYPPHLREQVGRQANAAAGMAPVLEHVSKTLGGMKRAQANPTTNLLNTKAEHEILPMIVNMSTDDIQALGTMASNQGKVGIARTCRLQLGRRNQQPVW